jgi:hypothetical protein
LQRGARARGVLVDAIALSSFASLCVAIGTLLLAAFTAFLAYETRRVARDTEEDVSAEWRPVLIATEQPPTNAGVGGGGTSGFITVHLTNVGRGPALNTSVSVTSQSSTEAMTSSPHNLGTVAVGALPPQTFDGLLFRDSSGGRQSFLRYTVTAGYRDLSGRLHKTVLTYDDPHRGSRDESEPWSLHLTDTQVLDFRGSSATAG